jgi:diguanylate cyclase (GGDEF) domain
MTPDKIIHERGDFMLSKAINLDDIVNSLDVLNKIYDSVRIINPLRKKVLTINEGALKETMSRCFDFLSKDSPCSNCISMRAFKENSTFFKLELSGNKVYIIIAVPVSRDTEDTIILELLKDVTNSMLVETPEITKNSSLIKTLNEIIQQQIRDGLTGVFNRRFINERLPVEIANDNADALPYSVIFADIDRFKLVNDTYGHVAGDYVLKEFADLLQKNITGTSDWVARYGGEEFLIFIRNANLKSAEEIAEVLRKEVEKSEFNFEGKNIKITSSFGVCTVSIPCNIKAEELVEAVDKNLYAAKESGRNRVVASEITL